MRSLNSRWIALVARKTWIRGRDESFTASAARSMSAGLHRAKTADDRTMDLTGDGLN